MITVPWWLHGLLLGALLGVVFHVVLRVERWVASRWVWYHRTVRSRYMKVVRLYQGLWWRVIPDGVFLMWLRAGFLDADDYRWLQDNGYVSNEVDPEYIAGYRGEDVSR